MKSLRNKKGGWYALCRVSVARKWSIHYCDVIIVIKTRLSRLASRN